jgi:hypothetical protein
MPTQLELGLTRPYALVPTSLGGAMPGIDLNKALSLAAALEDECIALSLKRQPPLNDEECEQSR